MFICVPHAGLNRILVLKLREGAEDGEEGKKTRDQGPTSRFAQFCAQTTLHGFHYLGTGEKKI